MISNNQLNRMGHFQLVIRPITALYVVLIFLLSILHMVKSQHSELTLNFDIYAIIKPGNYRFNVSEFDAELQHMSKIEPNLKGYTIFIKENQQIISSNLSSFENYNISVTLKPPTDQTKPVLNSELGLLVLSALFIDCRPQGAITWVSPSTYDPSATLRASSKPGWLPVYVNVNQVHLPIDLCTKIEQSIKLLKPICTEISLQKYTKLNDRDSIVANTIDRYSDAIITLLDLESCLIIIVSLWLFACLVIAIMLKRRDHRRLTFILENAREESEAVKDQGPSRRRSRRCSKPVILNETSIHRDITLNESSDYQAVPGQDCGVKLTMRQSKRDDNFDDSDDADVSVPIPEWGPIVFLKQIKTQGTEEERGKFFF